MLEAHIIGIMIIRREKLTPEKIWQQQIRNRIQQNNDYHIWKEWYELVWKLPTEDELLRRLDERDHMGLPFEYMKVYGNE